MINLPFQEWFTFHSLVGGDWKFFWAENLREILSYSFAWDTNLNTGLGKSNIPFLWLDSYLAYGSFLLTQIFHIPWGISEKILFFWPIVFGSFFSAFFLSKVFFREKFFNILSGVIYVTNTYALMIFSGGQVGVALAYSIAPFVLAAFIKLVNIIGSSNFNFKLESSNFKSSIVAGLALALQVLFDPRIAILCLIMVMLYILLYLKRLEKILPILLYVCLIPGIIVLFLHMFWILPILMSNINPVSVQLDSSKLSSGLVRFLSFAFFENTLSLLHPNWPDNIFGKIYFMRWEFLLMPIIAFSPLLFIGKNTKRDARPILFFLMVSLFGAFFAKGANPPFGEIYIWLTDHIQLFAMYRDSTKWYLLVAVAYSVLIPLCLWLTSELVEKKFKLQSSKLKVRGLLFVLFIFYLFFLLRFVFVGQVKGTFAEHSLPMEYVELKNFLSNQPEFFRTLWLPQIQRYGYSSNNHPAVTISELFGAFSAKNATQVILEDKKALLQEAGIKYIVIPFDSESEIFLTDRKYDDKERAIFIDKLEALSFLQKIEGFRKIAVYEVLSPKDHLFIDNNVGNIELAYHKENPTRYMVDIQNGKKDAEIIFSEGYDTNWVAKINKTKIPSSRFHKLFNSYVLPSDGDYSLKIYYMPQKWVEVGSAISLASFLFISLVLVFLRVKKGIWHF